MSHENAESPGKPLNARQKVFGRELGVALAAGKRNFEDAYVAAGYGRHRGNAARLAANPAVRAIADEACAKALALSGLHIGYLQGRALSLLDATATGIHRKVASTLTFDEKSQCVRMRDLSPKEEAELDAATWATSKLKVDKDGVVSVEIPDKKSVIEMLARMIGKMPDPVGDAIGDLGARLDRAIARVGSP